MNKTLQNLLLLGAVVALVVLSLWLVPVSGPSADGQKVEVFAGADGQAEGVIAELAPDYQPWAEALWSPPSGEIESLLFALQAALGALVIGYYIGFCRGRSLPKEQFTARCHVV